MPRPLVLLLAVVAAIAVAVAALDLTATPRAEASGPAVKHVFVIVLENEAESTSFGPGSPAPYLAKTLVSEGAFIPNYYGIGHASLDNYIAMISGQAPNPTTQADCGTFSEFVPTGPLTSDGQLPGSGCVYPSTVQTVAGQLDAAGLTWKGYMDSMGSDPAREAATCGHPAIGTADGTQVESATDQYATRHDPFMYFHSIIDNAALCNADVVPLTNLAADLASVGTTPNLSFITPGLCNDGHNTNCANGDPGGLPQVNTFLPGLINEIQASPAYKQDGLIVVTFDEGEGDSSSCCGEQSGPNVAQPGGAGPGGGPVGAVLLSPFIAPGTVTQTAYNHYSLLRSIEQTFGLSYLGYAGQAGLNTFGSDIFTAGGATTSSSTASSTTGMSSSSTSTTTASTGTTTAVAIPRSLPPVICHAQSSGAVIGVISISTGRKGRTLTFVARRPGRLTFQVHPDHRHARPPRHGKLAACQHFVLLLPAGHGVVHFQATAGKHKESESASY